MSFRGYRSTLVETTLCELVIALLFIAFAGLVIGARQPPADIEARGSVTVEVPLETVLQSEEELLACHAPGEPAPDERRAGAIIFFDFKQDLLESVAVDPAALEARAREYRECIDAVCRVVFSGSVLDRLGHSIERVEIRGHSSELWDSHDPPRCVESQDCNNALSADRARAVQRLCATTIEDAERQERYSRHVFAVAYGARHAEPGDRWEDRYVDFAFRAHLEQETEDAAPDLSP